LINGVATGMYECTQGSSNKFYEVTYVEATQMFQARYGRIGDQGNTASYSQQEARNKVREKLGKGYVLVTPYLNGQTAGRQVNNSTPIPQPNPLAAGAFEGLLLIRPVHSGPSINVAGVDFPLGKGGDFVPEISPEYHFPELTKDVCLDLIEGRNVILTGHMGTGKSSLFEQIAARIGQGIIRINCNGQMTVGAFVGQYGLVAGETVWVDGFLPEAMKKGYWVVLEEIDCAEARILSILNGILETKGKLFLKEKSGRDVIQAHPDTRFLATGNTVGSMEEFRPMYPGTTTLNEAFLDRFRIYKVDYLPEDQETRVLQNRYPNASVRTLKQFVQGASLIRQAFVKQEVEKTMSLRGLFDWIEMTGRKGDPIKALSTCFLSRVGFEDRQAIEKIIQNVF
jgi:cobaltochelatase CobS